MVIVILQRARRGKTLISSKLALGIAAPLVISTTLFLCAVGPSARAAKKATSQSGTQSNVRYQDDGEDADFDQSFEMDIDPTSYGNSSLAAPDDVADSADGCVGAPSYVPKGPEAPVTRTVFFVDPKDGKRKSKEVYDHMEQVIDVSCGSRLMRTIRRCTKDCPPQSPPPDLSRMVERQVGREIVRLQKPTPSLWPRPSTQAPLPGVAFFYGVTDDQFDRTQVIPLTACGSLDCASVILKAKPIGVYFDAGDGVGKRKSCTTSGPGVTSRKEATDAMKLGPNCWVTFQKAGTYRTTIYLRYLATWTFYQWTRLGVPVIGSGTRTGLTSRRMSITVHERQPVVLG
jgi:hypothetical protein